MSGDLAVCLQPLFAIGSEISAQLIALLNKEWWHSGYSFGLPTTKSVFQFPLRTLICKFSSNYTEI